MKTIQEAQESIFVDIPKENWNIAGDVQKELNKAWSIDESDFAEHVERIRKDAIEKYRDVIYSHYKFQIENGSIYDGAFEITIRSNVAIIVKHNITPAIKLLIEAKGGSLIEEHASQLVESQKLKERKAKPVKWQEREVTK